MKKILIAGLAGLTGIVLSVAPLIAQTVNTEIAPAQDYAYETTLQENFYNEFMALKAEINELKVLVVGLKNEVISKRAELNNLQGLLGETSSMLAELKRQKADMQAELAKGSLALAELHQEKENMRGELSQTRAELAMLKDQRAAAQDDTTKVNAALTALNQQKEKLQSDIAKISAQISALTSQRDDLQNDVSRSNAELTLNNKQLENKKKEATEFSVLPETVSQAAGSAKKIVDDGSVLETIYFTPDSIDIAGRVMPMLDEIGDKMKQDPAMKIAVRGYSAPAGTKLGQIQVSQARANRTAQYLMTKHGISEDRIIVEWVGAAEKPRNLQEGFNSTQLRAVEVSRV
jgi:outer membrane protein OmpA-like peptidoglycan-associated protein